MVHTSAEQLRNRLTRMMELQAERGEADTLGRARAAVAFVHREPDLVLLLDGRSGSTTAIWDELPDTPDLLFELPDALTAHQFWAGELNVMKALTEGRMKMRGNVLKAVALLPSSAANQAAYRSAVEMEERGFM
ncbi:hypothetical protein [Deinococcus pimensis]|uniref:hypothetical protein n=1 Tax=Deinococcus pimensis TaxID=309888 RepID=UPI0004855C8D|nr:hypothetical protein [Deinococcus pimensis]